MSSRVCSAATFGRSFILPYLVVSIVMKHSPFVNLEVVAVAVAKLISLPSFSYHYYNKNKEFKKTIWTSIFL